MPYKDPEKQREAQRKYEEKRRGKRHKAWLCVFYEDSSPNWADGLDEQGVAVCVSPVHNQDRWTKFDEEKNPKHKAGELKVDHRHLLAEFDNPTSYEEFKAFLEDAGIKSTNIKFARSVRGMARYLTHMDSPEKARYSDDAVAEFGGASWREWCERSEDDHAMLCDMRLFIVANEVADYWAFHFWCDANQPEWSRLLDRKCYGIREFIGSIRSWVEKGKPPVSWIDAYARAAADDDAVDPDE